MAEILKANETSYDRAILLLKEGQPVALPTETVYGLAGLASDDKAVASIYKIKSRPESKPFSIIVGSLEAGQKIARFSPLARQLARTFWPGPLTLVLPLKEPSNISPLALAGGNTIGVRCPDIQWMAHFVQAGFDHPLVLPSANLSGIPAPISAKDVDQDIGYKIPLIVDGGFCKIGVASTIIKIENRKARILRHGTIPPEALAPYPLVWRNS